MLKLQKEVQEIYVADQVLDYVADLSGSYKETCADHAGIKPAWNPGTGKDGKSSCLHERKGLCHSKGCAGGIQGRCGTQDVLDSKARYQEKTAREILSEILSEVPEPKVEG